MDRRDLFSTDGLLPANFGARNFATTAWSCVRAAGAAEAGARRRALEDLFRRYWRPIYGFIRVKWNRDREEARDLTQEFMVWVLESDFVAKADPRRGRFRAFLKTALSHFMSNELRDRQRLKRGGGERFFPLEVVDEDPPDAHAATPEELLDAEWKRILFETALERLQQTLESRRDTATYPIFREYYLGDDESPDQSSLAAKHGLTVSALNHRLEQARADFRRIVVDLVAESVSSDGDLAEELREILS